jgi:hypothetical protein
MAAVVEKMADVASFQSAPNWQGQVVRHIDQVTLKAGDELRVVLISYPPRPYTWYFLFGDNTPMAFEGSSRQASGGRQCDEYRFRATLPAGAQFTEAQTLRFMYASDVGPLDDVAFYELEAKVTP